MDSVINNSNVISGPEIDVMNDTELVNALISMITNLPRFTTGFYILRTISSNSADIIPKNKYTCIASKVNFNTNASSFGTVLFYSYHDARKIYLFQYLNGAKGTSKIATFSTDTLITLN